MAFQSLEKEKIIGEKKNSRGGGEGKERRREMSAIRQWLTGRNFHT